MFTGRTDPEAEATILWPSHEKRTLSGKDPDVGKVWLDSVIEDAQHEFVPTLGGSGRQEGLACSGPWGHEELDMT